MLSSLPQQWESGQWDVHELFVRTITESLEAMVSGPVRTVVPVQRRGTIPPLPQSGMHLHFELFFQLRGQTRFHTPGRTFRLLPDQLAILPPLVPHAEQAGRWRGDFMNVVVMLTPDQLRFHLAGANAQGTPVGRKGRGYSPRRSESIQRALGEMTAAVDRTDTAGRFRRRGALTTAMAVLLEALQDEPLAEESDHPYLVRCRRIIANHLSDPTLNVQTLAERIGCSADYLSNLFRRHVGLRLIEYLNVQRIDRACRLLHHSDLTISEVAWATGYGDPSYFSRCFSKVTGRCPRKYRTEQGR